MNTEENKALEAEAECCESFQVHSDMVEAVRCHMPEDELLDSISDTFKVFGDKTRIKILYVLHTCELCVCDIAQLLDMNQSAISHQLRTPFSGISAKQISSSTIGMVLLAFLESPTSFRHASNICFVFS